MLITTKYKYGFSMLKKIFFTNSLRSPESRSQNTAEMFLMRPPPKSQ